MEPDLLTYIDQKCNAFESSILIRDSSGRSMTYGRFRSEVHRAASLMDDVSEGIRFSIALPNCAEFLYLLFGGLSRGGSAVNLNPHMSEDEFECRLKLARVRVLYTTEKVRKRIAGVVGKLGIRVVLIAGDFYEPEPADTHSAHRDYIDLSGVGSPERTVFQASASDPERTAFLQFTGGTTGTIKAAMILHRNVLASIGQMSEHLAPRLKRGEEEFLVTFPFYHVFSIVFQVLTAMHFGSRILIYPVVRDLPTLKRLLLEETFTVFVGVHTLYKWMLGDDVLRSRTYPNARLFIAGAEPILAGTKQEWQACTGHLIVEGYGLTETSALASMSAVDASKSDIDGIGLPLPRTEFKLVGDDGHIIETDGCDGEICIRGPQVAAGYFNNEADTRRTFIDGWLHTGDMGIRKANGQYKIVGRKKDLINVSGFNVYPSEVESVLQQYPDVLECAVASIPDHRSGERVAAYLVSRTPVDEAEVISWCRHRLSGYKVPVQVHRVESLPKSAVGKILRRELARQMR